MHVKYLLSSRLAIGQEEIHTFTAHCTLPEGRRENHRHTKLLCAGLAVQFFQACSVDPVRARGSPEEKPRPSMLSTRRLP